jgi:hypothetical protein
MADLSNLKIANTFSRLLQVDPDTTQLQDGVGDNPSTIIFNGTTLKYVDGNQQNNYVLTSDSDGIAKWAAAGGSSTDVYWSASSADGTFIVNSGMTNSKVGIGTTVPNQEFSVSGAMSASSHVYVGDDLYVDMIRRAGNNSTTTKIKNNASNWEIYAGSSSLWSTKVSSHQLQVGQNGAGFISAETINAPSISATTLYGTIDGGSF